MMSWQKGLSLAGVAFSFSILGGIADKILNAQQVRSTGYAAVRVVDCAGYSSSVCPNPAGVVDGTNITFTPSSAPLGSAYVEVFKNGVRETQMLDYTFGKTATGQTTIVMTTAPQQGDGLILSYSAEFALPLACSKCLPGQP